MKDMMEHGGYLGSVYYNDADGVFHGKLEFIRPLVSYEGTDVKSLKKAFREAVADYVGTCEASGKEPETPFKGSFNVRSGPELHRRAALWAQTQGTTLNQVVVDALRNYLDRGANPTKKRTKKGAAV